MTEDERDSFIIFKIWSLSKSPFPTIFLTNILWGRFIPLHPSSPPAVTATMHRPHSWAVPTPCSSPKGLLICQAQPLPTTHAPPLPVSPAGQPWGTRAKPCPGSHAASPGSCMTAQVPLQGTDTHETLNTQTPHEACVLLPSPSPLFLPSADTV